MQKMIKKIETQKDRKTEKKERQKEKREREWKEQRGPEAFDTQDRHTLLRTAGLGKFDKR